MIVPDKLLINLQSMLDIDKPSTPIPETGPVCLGCKEPLEFSDYAKESFSLQQMCVVNQTVFRCPECYCQMVIFGVGRVNSRPTPEGDLAFDPPEGGLHIAKVSVL